MKILAVKVLATGRLGLPFLGLPMGLRSVRPATDVSATIKFLDVRGPHPLLSRTPGGLWVGNGLQGVPAVGPQTPIGVDLKPGESMALLVAAKLEGDECCYALDGALRQGFLIPEMAIAAPEVDVRLGLAGLRLSAYGRYQLLNPGKRLEEFDLVRS